MSPRVKEAWMMTGLVVAGMTAFATYQLYRSTRYSGEPPDLGSAVMTYGFFGLITLLGIGFAWIRVFQDRKARRNRAKPLDLG